MTMTKRSDAQIDLDVLHELAWDTRLDATGIDVQTRSGVVTLTGTVDNWAARHAARDAAHRVKGVLDVANDLQVTLRGWDGRTDTEIAQTVRRALEWDVLVPHERIHSTVTAGVVTLDGTVDYLSQREDAARAIRNLAGVRDVRNQIALQPPEVEPARLRAAIEAALQRHAAHSAKHVHLAIEGGSVVVTGKVPSHGEHDAIVGVITGTPGVRMVEDHLAVHGRLPRRAVLGP